jgi:beta-lactamase regulating signal transducer with metallopeptidase domain
VDALLNFGLANAVTATALALFVAGVSWMCRRPAFVHALWLLVLLKLLTPPLLAVPFIVPSGWLSPKSPDRDLPQAVEEPPSLEFGAGVIADQSGPQVIGPIAAADSPPLFGESMVGELPDAVRQPDLAPETKEPSSNSDTVFASWRLWLLAAWLSGSACCFALACYRLCRFRRLFGSMQPAAPELQEQARQLASRLGIARTPGIWLVPAPVSPMLLAPAGRPRLLLPAALWQHLSHEQRDTLLVHELAHLRRRDHWVRWLECAVTGLYWWHPVVWWARRELRIAEEHCCDAWVAWALPEASQSYATALVETITFVSKARVRLPLTASGVGHLRLLRRRLTMIIRGTTPRALGWTGFLLVLGLGAILLPLVPTWAVTQPNAGAAEEQDTGQAGTPSAQPMQAPGGQPAVAGAARGMLAAPAMIPPVKPQDIEAARDEVEILEAELAVKRAEMEEMQPRINKAKRQVDRLANVPAGVGLAEDRPQAEDDLKVLLSQLATKRAEVQVAEIRLKQAKRRFESLRGQGGVGGGVMAPGPGVTGGQAGMVGRAPPRIAKRIHAEIQQAEGNVSIQVDGESVTLGKLASVLSRIVNDTQRTELDVRVSAKTDFRTVLAVQDAAKEAGIQSIHLRAGSQSMSYFFLPEFGSSGLAIGFPHAGGQFGLGGGLGVGGLGGGGQIGFGGGQLGQFGNVGGQFGLGGGQIGFGRSAPKGALSGGQAGGQGAMSRTGAAAGTTPSAPHAPEQSAPSGMMGAGPRVPADNERRLGEVERKLDLLLKELQTLRREVGVQQTPPRQH